jgi:hypothetical protein
MNLRTMIGATLETGWALGVSSLAALSAPPPEPTNEKSHYEPNFAPSFVPRRPR